MPTKKSNRTPSKDGDDYDELTFELEQQRRQNEAKDMALEAKDMALEYKDKELRQQGDRLANLELQMKAMAEAIRQGQHHGRQGLQLQEQRQGQDRGNEINMHLATPATGRQGQRMCRRA